MTKHRTVLVTTSLATLLALFAPTPRARADIFQWEYINPANPSQGKQPSTTLTPDGAGANAVPGTNLSNRDLTKAYLIGANLGPDSGGCGEFGCDYFYPSYLVDTNLNQADLTDANLHSAVLTNANLRQANLTHANLITATLTNANLSQGNLTNAGFWYATLIGANLTGAEVRGASFNRGYLDFPYDNFLGGITVAQLYSTASYQAHDLTAISLSGNDLTGVNLANQNLTNAILGGTYLTGANLSQANLTNAAFGYATLTGANFTDAEVREADFSRDDYNPDGGITLAQLYSTASYQAHDLAGIGLSGNNLGGANLAGQNLTNALFALAKLTNANLSQANLTNADFLYATLTNANLSQANLTHARFSQETGSAHSIAADLSGANLGGANLANAYFAGEDWCDNGCGTSPGANLTNANLSGADARGANFYAATLTGANTSNLIQSDGHIAGLDLTAGASLVVRDYDGNPYYGFGPIPIKVDQHLAMDTIGKLRLVFDADPWDSTISFAPGIPVARGGTLELTFASDVNLASQVGRTIDLFNWTGVTPTGTFTVSSPYTWNLSNLYTTGEVTLTAVPSLPGDFNLDGTVDAADYVVWRKTGINGPTGYDTWRTNFGQPTGGGSVASANATVPEPTTLVMLIVAAVGIRLRRRDIA